MLAGEGTQPFPSMPLFVKTSQGTSKPQNMYVFINDNGCHGDVLLLSRIRTYTISVPHTETDYEKNFHGQLLCHSYTLVLPAHKLRILK